MPTDTALPHLVRTDIGWADVVIDLRNDRTAPIRATRPGGRRKAKAAIGDTRITGSAFRTTTGDGPAVDEQYLIWTDPTGFTAAVVTSHQDDLRAVLPHVAHLTAPPGNRWKNTNDPLRTGETRFADSTDGLRRILTDGTLTSPLPETSAPLDSRVQYRLAWASVGITDITTIPLYLRDWDRASEDERKAIRSRNDSSRNWFPANLTLRGPNMVARWQRYSTFTDPDDIAEWAHCFYGSASDANFAVTATQMADMGAWRDAGWSAPDAHAWMPAAQTDTIANPHRAPAETVLAFKRAGGTPAMLRWMLSALPEGAPASVSGKHLQTWLNVAPPARAAWYVAAGISKTEARRMERASDVPDLTVLRTLAAMRNHDPALTLDMLDQA